MAEKFVETLRKKLEDKGLSASSIKVYLTRLSQLNDKKPFSSLMFLKDKAVIDARIQRFADSTKSSYYGMLTSILNLFPNLKKTADKYHETYAEFKARPPHEGKTPKQTENWMSWKDVQAVQQKLLKEVGGFKGALDPYEFSRLQALVILSLYVEIPPRRNADYLGMVFGSEPHKGTNTCVIKKKSPTEFVFGHYKTSKKYGIQTIEIPDALKDILKVYFEHARVEEGAPFLQTQDGSGLTAQNSITRILNHTLGKKVGSSMLRHIFVSDKYGDAKQEMEKDAEAMGHSVETQQQIYNVGK